MREGDGVQVVWCLVCSCCPSEVVAEGQTPHPGRRRRGDQRGPPGTGGRGLKASETRVRVQSRPLTSRVSRVATLSAPQSGHL